jgi:hypothetical protein
VGNSHRRKWGIRAILDIRATVEEVEVKIPDELGAAGVVRWGKQLDVQQLSTEDEERWRWAGYLAKYTTKSTEQVGGLLHRVDRSEVDHAAVSEHNRRYLHTAFELHDRVSDAIAVDPLPTPPPPPPRPAPAQLPPPQRTDPPRPAGDEHKRTRPHPTAHR